MRFADVDGAALSRVTAFVTYDGQHRHGAAIGN